MSRTVDSCFRPVRSGGSASLVLFLLAAATFAAGPAGAQSTAADPPEPIYGARGEMSVGILFGVGWYDNTEFNQALVGIGVEPIETGFEYGAQFRKRLSHYVSLGGELARLDGRSTTLEGGGGSEFGIAGTVVFLDAFVHPLQVGGVGLTLFAGGGPVFGVRLSQTFPDGYIVEGKKTGFGWHAGAEGEVRFGENFGFFVRGLTRRAGADDIFLSADPTADPLIFDADFDGVAVSFGPRWHWGGQGEAP